MGVNPKAIAYQITNPSFRRKPESRNPTLKRRVKNPLPLEGGGLGWGWRPGWERANRGISPHPLREPPNMVENPPLNENSSAVQAHLTIMQGVINRMAENSRSCKVWCVTLVAATLVLVARTGEPQHALIALVPTALLWFLDAYYLGLERRFRNSYNDFVAKVHRGNVGVTDLYQVKPVGSAIGQFLWAMFRSLSTLPFYVLVTATILLAWWLIIPSDTLLNGG